MKLIITLIFCLFLSIGYGQTLTEWFPVGAEYYYDYIEYNRQGLPNDTGFYKLIVEKDTIINDKNCKVLLGNPTKGNGIPHVFQHKFYVLSENKQLYIYQESEFYLLYDFNLSVGDTGESIMVPYYNGLKLQYIIDSIKVVDYLGNSTVQYIHYLPNSILCGFTPHLIVEFLGNATQLFYLLNYLCDGVYPEHLRCYRDGVNDLTFIDRPCDYVVNKVSNQQILQSQINICPNPIYSTLFIDNQSNKAMEVFLYNVFGQLLKSFDISTGINSIDVSTFANGNYFLVSQDNFVKPFVKM
ncbi:MAG: T9SS type A sorting domain-containing protein [Chitinophagales bacterium]|nr:T9SS type A sorting domain-containing protein [Chitinophagales bacterium]